MPKEAWTNGDAEGKCSDHGYDIVYWNSWMVNVNDTYPHLSKWAMNSEDVPPYVVAWCKNKTNMSIPKQLATMTKDAITTGVNNKVKKLLCYPHQTLIIRKGKKAADVVNLAKFIDASPQNPKTPEFRKIKLRYFQFYLFNN